MQCYTTRSQARVQRKYSLGEGPLPHFRRWRAISLSGHNDDGTVSDADRKAKHDYERFNNRHHAVRPLSALPSGPQARIRTDDRTDWASTSVIKDPAGAPCSYTLETDGRILRRNRCHPRARGTSPTSPPRIVINGKSLYEER